jgi:hypothetical protein
LAVTDQQGSGRACIFCGTTNNLTKEHLWPAWFNQELPNITDTTITLTRPGQEPRSWIDKDIAGLEIATVCGDCNHGWMARTEHAAKPLLVPMFSGRQITLDRPQQAALALWAVTRAIVGEYLDPPNAVVPFQERSWLREHERPMRGSHVFIAGIDDQWSRDHANFRSYRLLPDPRAGRYSPTTQPAYVATLLIKYLAIQVVWIKDFKNAALGFKAILARSVERIWPFVQSFTWPPGPILPSQGIEALIDAWRAPPAS